MVLRFLIRILANNEHLVHRLSESYPMRRAAQIVVRAVFSTKNFVEERRLHEKLTPEQFRALMTEVAANFQNKIKQAQDSKLHEKFSSPQFRASMSEAAANFQNKIKQAQESKLHEKFSSPQFRESISEAATNFQKRIKQARENFKDKMK